MKTKLNITSILLLISFVLSAQKKFYIIPNIGFYSGAYRGVDSVNSKQTLIKTRPFLRKDFIIGVKLSYIKNNMGISLGIESGKYSSGFKHFEDDSNPIRVISRESTSQGSIHIFFAEARYEILSINLKKPKWLKRISNSDKPLILNSRIAPLFGFEFRRLGNTFVQDYPESSEFSTSQEGNISGTNWFHSYKKNHFSMKAGFEWVFYDSDKRRFIITFIYKFALKDAGYFRYHFEKPSRGIDFYYQNNTKGNGFSINVGLPIKLSEIGKRKKMKRV